MNMYFPTSLYILVLLELLLVSYLDIKYKTIKNHWSLLNIFIFIFLYSFMGDSFQLTFNLFYFSLAILFAGFVFFKLNIMGAGDTKILVTLFLVIPESFQENYFLCLVYSTFLIGGATLLVNLIKNHKKLFNAILIRDVKLVKVFMGGKFPFAPVIFIAWLGFGWVNAKHIF